MQKLPTALIVINSNIENFHQLGRHITDYSRSLLNSNSEKSINQAGISLNIRTWCGLFTHDLDFMISVNFCFSVPTLSVSKAQ